MLPFSPPSPPRPSTPPTRSGGRTVSVKKLSTARAAAKRTAFNAPSLPASMQVKATRQFGGKGTSARDLIRGGCCGAQPSISPPTISTPVAPATPSVETPTAPAVSCPIGWTKLPNGTCVDERG